MSVRANVFIVYFFFSSRRRHTRCLSDWSSDVCSSDLRRRRDLGGHAARLEQAAEMPQKAEPGHIRRRVDANRDHRPGGAGVEIGRASCRERGWVWVGGGTLNNKQEEHRTKGTTANVVR